MLTDLTKKNADYQMDRVIYKPFGIRDDDYKKAIQDQRKNYRSANKLGKKAIMDCHKRLRKFKHMNK